MALLLNHLSDRPNSTNKYQQFAAESQRLDTFVDSHRFLVGNKYSLSQDHLLQSNLKNVHCLRRQANWNGSQKRTLELDLKYWDNLRNLKLLIVNPFLRTPKMASSLQSQAASLKFTAVILVEHTSVGSRHQMFSSSPEKSYTRAIPTWDLQKKFSELVGGWVSTHLKKIFIRQNCIISPSKFRDEKLKKYLSCHHHLVKFSWTLSGTDICRI